VHVAEGADVEYVPAGQIEQEAAVRAEYQPAEQAVQDGDVVATAEY